MEIKTYFFDTYAFHEIVANNKNYKPFTDNVGIVTTKLNLMELYYGSLLEHNKRVADKVYDSLVKFCVSISDDVIKEAMLFKVLNKNKNLSYVDCVGYFVARKMNIKFLTGDKEFKGLDGVEFVK